MQAASVYIPYTLNAVLIQYEATERKYTTQRCPSTLLWNGSSIVNVLTLD